MTAKPLTAAAADYAARTARIHALLVNIERSLAAHAKRAGQSPKNWAYVGDLGRAEDLLNEVVDSVGGRA
jgi:hypothetical protein